jgi:hypothetical protein
MSGDMLSGVNGCRLGSIPAHSLAQGMEINMWYVCSKTWGNLDAVDMKVKDGIAYLIDTQRLGKPFYSECMIPMHDVTLIVPPEARKK